MGRNWMAPVSLALCALLLAAGAAQALRLRELEAETAELRRQAETFRQETAERLEALERRPARIWPERSRVDAVARTLSLRFLAVLPETEETVWVRVRQGEGGLEPPGEMALFRRADGVYWGETTLPLEPEGGVEISGADGTVLYTCETLTALLPVRLRVVTLDLLLNRLEARAYQRECRVELTDLAGEWAEVSQAEYRVYRNGAPVLSGRCALPSAGPAELPLWEVPLEETDTLSYHFLCTDRYGLRYDFTLDDWDWGPDGALVRSQPAAPVLVWPEQDAGTAEFSVK